MKTLNPIIYVKDFLDLFIPNTCLLCGFSNQNKRQICPICLTQLPYTRFWESESNALLEHLSARVPCELAIACFYFIKRSPVQHILHEIKYKQNRSLTREMGELFGQKLQQFKPLAMCSIITPVPLTRKKLKSRGYNQSHELALGIGTTLDIPVETDLLTRIRDGKSQTNKSRTDRYYQLEGSFEANPERVKGHRVLLVDDVSTTGATAEICLSELLKAGAESVGLLCLAYRADF